MEPRKEVVKTLPAIIQGLESTREKLGGIVEGYFNRHANESVLWENRHLHIAKPVAETDPPLAKFCKHSLLAMQDLEKLAKLLDEYNNRGFFGKRLRLPDTAYKVIDLIYSNLSVHLQALAKMAKESGIPDQAMSSFNSLMSLDFNKLSSEGIQQLTQTLPQLNDSFSGLMQSYFNNQRPDAPVEPERQYQPSKEIKIKLLRGVPASFDAFQSDTYLVIKEKNKNWQVIYLDSKKNPEKVDLIDVTGLAEVLANKSKEDISEADEEAIQKLLAVRWNPTSQERTEWFGILLEPMRGAVRQVGGLTDFLAKYIDQAKQRGEHFNATEEDLIKKTTAALEKAEIDKNGYYRYTKEETPLSQSLKAIFNLVWATNELSRGFWERSKIGAYKQATENGLLALQHYFKIDWPNIGENLKGIMDQLVNAMLIHGKDTAFPKLADLASQIHDFEAGNHLQYGALTDTFGNLFRQVESVYIDRGIAITNPFGSSEAEKEKMQKRADALEKKREAEEGQAKIKVEKKSAAVDALSKRLKEYANLGNYSALHKDPLPAVAALAAGQFLDPTPAALNVWISPILKAPRELLREGVTTVVGSAVSFAEGLRRNYLNFPRIDFLLEIAHVRELNFILSDDLDDLNNLEDQIISEMTLEEKRKLLDIVKLPSKRPHKDYNYLDLIKKLAKAIGTNKKENFERETKSYFSRVVAASGEGIVNVLKEWPPLSVKNLGPSFSAMNKKFAKQQLDRQTLDEAKESHQKQRLVYGEQLLESKGLNWLVRATEVSLHDEKSNLPQKRQLAVILADYHDRDRKACLLSAHLIASDFVAEPEEIKNFILGINDGNKELGHALALEAMIAGYVPNWADKNILVSNDESVTHKDFVNILMRVEAGQITNMIDQASEGDLNAMTRYALLNLLMTNKKMGPSSLDEVFTESDTLEYSRSAFLETLAARYKESDASDRNLIGQFIGRLTRADKEIANLVFKDNNLKSILEKECLNKNPSLFYESLVNTLNFDYIEDKHEEESRPYAEFLEKNRSVVLTIHKAIHRNETKSDEEIIREYQNDAWDLCQLTEKFIKTRLSAGSPAEEKLREFFSALLLCPDVQAARQEVLNKQQTSQGSVRVQYIELLTIKSSVKFWNIVRKNLIDTPKDALFLDFDQKVNDLKKKSEEFETQEQKNFNLEVHQFIEGKKNAINKIANDLLAKNKDPALHARYAHQEINKVKDEVAEQYKLWDKEIKDRVNIRDLSKKLKEVDGVLTDYLKERGTLKAALLSAIGYGLRLDKVNLVTNMRDQLRTIITDLQSAKPEDYEVHAKKAIQLGKRLVDSHTVLLNKSNKIIEQESKKASDPLPPVVKPKSGKLGSTISQIQVLLGEAKEGTFASLKSEVQDDLPKRISLVEKFFKSISTRYEAWRLSKKKLPSLAVFDVQSDLKKNRVK